VKRAKKLTLVENFVEAITVKNDLRSIGVITSQEYSKDTRKKPQPSSRKKRKMIHLIWRA